MPKRPPVYVNRVVAHNRAMRPREPKTAQASGDHNRPHSRARGYDRTWERLRRMHLNEHPFCVFCERKGRVTVATVADHIQTIEEAPERRLDPTNIQSLCAPCHNGEKQRLDRARLKAKRVNRS